MIVLRQAEIYAPEYAGRQDILIAGGRIEKIGNHLDWRRGSGNRRAGKCGSGG